MKDIRLSLNLNILWGLAYTQQCKTSHTHMKIESLSERARGSRTAPAPSCPSGEEKPISRHSEADSSERTQFSIYKPFIDYL